MLPSRRARVACLTLIVPTIICRIVHRAVITSTGCSQHLRTPCQSTPDRYTRRITVIKSLRKLSGGCTPNPEKRPFPSKNILGYRDPDHIPQENDEEVNEFLKQYQGSSQDSKDVDNEIANLKGKINIDWDKVMTSEEDMFSDKFDAKYNITHDENEYKNEIDEWVKKHDSDLNDKQVSTPKSEPGLDYATHTDVESNLHQPQHTNKDIDRLSKVDDITDIDPPDDFNLPPVPDEFDSSQLPHSRDSSHLPLSRQHPPISAQVSIPSAGTRNEVVGSLTRANEGVGTDARASEVVASYTHASGASRSSVSKIAMEMRGWAGRASSIDPKRWKDKHTAGLMPDDTDIDNKWGAMSDGDGKWKEDGEHDYIAGNPFRQNANNNNNKPPVSGDIQASISPITPNPTYKVEVSMEERNNLIDQVLVDEDIGAVMDRKELPPAQNVSEFIQHFRKVFPFQDFKPPDVSRVSLPIINYSPVTSQDEGSRSEANARQPDGLTYKRPHLLTKGPYNGSHYSKSDMDLGGTSYENECNIDMPSFNQQAIMDYQRYNYTYDTPARDVRDLYAPSGLLAQKMEEARARSRERKVRRRIKREREMQNRYDETVKRTPVTTQADPNPKHAIPRGYAYDDYTGYYYESRTKMYFDPKTGLYGAHGRWYRWEKLTQTFSEYRPADEPD